jgi:hypothetical protein
LRAFFRWPMANLTMEPSDWERAETVGFPNGGYYTKEWSNTIELRSWHGSYQPPAFGRRTSMSTGAKPCFQFWTISSMNSKPRSNRPSLEALN